jgi:hypothetical protein
MTIKEPQLRLSSRVYLVRVLTDVPMLKKAAPSFDGADSSLTIGGQNIS